MNHVKNQGFINLLHRTSQIKIIQTINSRGGRLLTSTGSSGLIFKIARDDANNNHRP